LARGNRAFEATIEVARRIIPEMLRAVLEDGLWMDDQPIEAHRVDERLQR